MTEPERRVQDHVVTRINNNNKKMANTRQTNVINQLVLFNRIFDLNILKTRWLQLQLYPITKAGHQSYKQILYVKYGPSLASFVYFCPFLNTMYKIWPK